MPELKRIICFFIAAIMLMSVSGSIGEIVPVQYEADPVSVDCVEDLYGVWHCRYRIKNGEAYTYEDLREDEFRYENPNLTDEEIAAKVAENMLYLEIGDDGIYSYIDNSDRNTINMVFEDGKLISYENTEVPVIIEKLSDGNVQVVNGSGAYVFERIQEDGFLFRDKIRWGMSVEEVETLEGEPASIREINEFSMLLYPDVQVSQYRGILVYVLSSDALAFSAYGVEDSDQEMFEYMRTALDSVYGAEADAHASRHELFEILKVLSDVDPDESELDDVPICKWETADGTLIYLAMEDDMMLVLYVSPGYLSTEKQEINTTGL